MVDNNTDTVRTQNPIQNAALPEALKQNHDASRGLREADLLERLAIRTVERDVSENRQIELRKERDELRGKLKSIRRDFAPALEAIREVLAIQAPNWMIYYRMINAEFLLKQFCSQHPNVCGPQKKDAP